MLSPLDILAIASLVILGWYMVTSLKMRETANQIARMYCEQRGLLFLDASVSFGTLSVVRHAGKLKLRRVYVFAYSREAIDRLHGIIIFTGGEYDSLVLLDEEQDRDHTVH